MEAYIRYESQLIEFIFKWVFSDETIQMNILVVSVTIIGLVKSWIILIWRRKYQFQCIVSIVVIAVVIGSVGKEVVALGEAVASVFNCSIGGKHLY